MLLKTLPTGTPATVAFGRKQFAYVFQGNGVRPSRVDLTDGTIADMGVDTPTVAPTVTPQYAPQYYVARIDVIEGGVGYNKPPAVTLDGGDPVRPATAKAYLTGTALGDVDVVEYGRGYKTAPTVNLSSTYGSGATFTAILDGAAPTATGPGGPMTKYRIVSECLTNVRVSITCHCKLGIVCDSFVWSYCSIARHCSVAHFIAPRISLRRSHKNCNVWCIHSQKFKRLC